MEDDEVSQVFAFWFGALGEDELTPKARTKRWFTKSAAFDREIRERFGTLHERVAQKQHETWRQSVIGRLCYVIVLDQFSRNIYRDSRRMFAYDAAALAVSEEGIAAGDLLELQTDPQAFLLMPLMHSEEAEDQDTCVRTFKRLCERASGQAAERLQNNLNFAEKHREIIVSFGRFPHRNALLDRRSTAEELAFLQEPGSGF